MNLPSRQLTEERAKLKSPSTENLILNPNALFTFLNIKYSYQLHFTCIYTFIPEEKWKIIGMGKD